jgi:beta-galactosidase
MKKTYHTINIPILLLMLLLMNGCHKAKNTAIQPSRLFNDNWQFILSADSSAVFNSESNLAWEKVRLPHTPVTEPLVVNNQWQGICWYRKDFKLPAGAVGKRLFLRFEGAMNVADIWVNGVKKITHLGGYLPFEIDFTNEAVADGLNHVIVRLDNTDNPITGPKPLKQLDFNTYGGLYRDVFLIMKNSVFITDPIFENKPGSGGIFVTYPEVSEEKAVIRVETHIRNTGTGEQDIVVNHQILNFCSNRCRDVKFYISAESLPAVIPSNLTNIATISIDSPKLWSPSDPNLYFLVTQVFSDGQLTDTDTTRIGIRHFEITKDHFSINGEEMFLRGVNRHQEYPYIGYALSNNAQFRDARLIKEAGFDYVRLSHYPHSPAFMDACDELGLLVLDAIPGWQYYSEDEAFKTQVIQTCRDMIRRDRNHACVMAWEVSLNESWMQEEFIDRAVAAAREEYPGDGCFTAGWMNYGYDIFLQARQHRLEHYVTPQKPYIVSEYGDWEYYAMNAGLDQDKWKDLAPDDRSSRQYMTSGEKRLLQQATNIQEAHNDNFNTPAFADGYWSMFDYNRGYTDDIETSGIMSILRVPKFSYYFFKSQRDADEVSPLFSSGPMVFIASCWDENSSSNVRVFSNCEEVELTLNGVLISSQKPDTGRISGNLAHPPFTFSTGKFQPGTLIATGYIQGEKAVQDTVVTPGKPKALKLICDESGRPLKAGCNDAVFIRAIIVDENGNKVPVNDQIVIFSISGDATVINPESKASTEAGIATALIRIGEKPGEISITADAEGLISGHLVIHSN